MDVIEEYIKPTLQRLDHYIPPSVSLQAASYLDVANTHFQSMRDVYVDPYVVQPLNAALNSPPDAFSVLILLAILFISLKILNYARRVITFWVVLVFRLAFWGVILGAAWYAYTVGWEKSSKDAMWAFGLLEGFIQELLSANANGKGGDGVRSFMSQSWGNQRAQFRWT